MLIIQKRNIAIPIAMERCLKEQNSLEHRL